MTTISRKDWVDNLRSFLTILVVAHHSSLAYTTWAHFNTTAYAASTHPVVDSTRWKGMDRFEDFNDVFFMSLMFLISGIFVPKSLEKKGVTPFLRDRFHRLFIPFIIGVTLLMPIAYYPSWRLAHHNNDLKAFLKDYITTEGWPAGPPWFIWVLFAFNGIFALSYPITKNQLQKISTYLATQKQRPIAVFLTGYGLTWLIYVPVILIVDPGAWTGLGPFDFQISRVLLYFVYFLLGTLLSLPALETGLFSDSSALIKKWPVWLITAGSAYTLLKLSEPPLTRMLHQHQLTKLQATLIYRSIWTLSCTASSIAFLTTFKTFFNKSRWASLSDNAYGIYLVHYIFVIWCQYYLLNYTLPAVIKFGITFIVSVLLSWLIVGLFRKNRHIRNYL